MIIDKKDVEEIRKEIKAKAKKEYIMELSEVIDKQMNKKAKEAVNRYLRTAKQQLIDLKRKLKNELKEVKK